jgi:hypothetical protein
MEREFWAADRNALVPCALDGIGYAIELTLCNDNVEDAVWTGMPHKAYSTGCDWWRDGVMFHEMFVCVLGVLSEQVLTLLLPHLFAKKIVPRGTELGLPKFALYYTSPLNKSHIWISKRQGAKKKGQ